MISGSAGEKPWHHDEGASVGATVASVGALEGSGVGSIDGSPLGSDDGAAVSGNKEGSDEGASDAGSDNTEVDGACEEEGDSGTPGITVESVGRIVCVGAKDMKPTGCAVVRKVGTLVAEAPSETDGTFEAKAAGTADSVETSIVAMEGSADSSAIGTAVAVGRADGTCVSSAVGVAVGAAVDFEGGAVGDSVGATVGLGTDGIQVGVGVLGEAVVGSAVTIVGTSVGSSVGAAEAGISTLATSNSAMFRTPCRAKAPACHISSRMRAMRPVSRAMSTSRTKNF
jgi:hypothetical protein